jgi:hypothetical protein
VCPECGHAEDFTALRTREPMQCRHCRHRTALSAGTLFAHTKLPLTLWFLAMSLLTQRKNAISALALKRHLGVSCPTAWKVKHKLLQVMLERDADRQPSGVSEIDDVSRGGEVHGETPGRGSPDKTPFVAVVAKTDKGHPIALCRSVVAGFRKTEPAHWAAKFIHPDSIVVSGGLACCRGLADAGIEPRAMVTGRGAGGVELPEREWVNTILGNVKTVMRGTDPQACPRHLPRYLTEFCYRFSGRFDLAAILPRLGVAAARTRLMPDRLLKLAETHW